MSGIYIHIPFCRQSCYYCDFHFSTSLKRKGDMLDAIMQELILRKEEINSPVNTIYFGGGTPSLMDTAEIEGILQVIEEHYKLVGQPEITLEANPDDLSADKTKELAASPVNRLSIGVQSFFDKDLEYMNRAHNAAEAKRSLELAAKYFNNISIDLIYGIPGLSEKRWRQNLEYTFEMGIQHISSYALTVEPKTALDHFIKTGRYKAPEEEAAEKHFTVLQEVTKQQGFIQYEISNFGKEGFFSRHNTSYWQGIPYMGIGPSAHSFDGDSRSWNVSNNAKYLKAMGQKILPSERELLQPEDRINELVMTGLRTIWGLSLKEISSRFGEHYKSVLLRQAEKHLREGRLYVKGGHLFLRPEFYFFADGISSDLFLLKVSDI